MTTRPPSPILDFKPDAGLIKTLKMQGVDGSAFGVLRSPFLLDDALTSIQPHVPAWLPEDYDLPKLNVRRQIEACNRMLTNPLHGSPILGIGSMATDDRAKFLAMQFMMAAIAQQKAGTHRGKILPIWHRVMGGYQDDLRDLKERKNTSMLIITNVGPDSTPQKIEKVRDLLEIYDHIPRIVVMNGADPVSFFVSKIRMTMQFAIFLSNTKSNKHDLMGML